MTQPEWGVFRIVRTKRYERLCEECGEITNWFQVFFQEAHEEETGDKQFVQWCTKHSQGVRNAGE